MSIGSFPSMRQRTCAVRAAGFRRLSMHAHAGRPHWEHSEGHRAYSGPGPSVRVHYKEESADRETAQARFTATEERLSKLEEQGK
jgi:hypothetical protein